MLRRRVIKSGGPKESALQRELTRADRLTEREDYDEAIELLQDLNERYPRRTAVLRRLAGVAALVQDPYIFEDAVEILTEIHPDDPDHWADLISARLLNTRPCLAIQAMRHLEARWPHNEMAREHRDHIPDLEEVTEEMMQALGLPGPDRIAQGALHERIDLLMRRGDYKRLRETAAELLESAPGFIPTRNTLSQVEFAEGRLPEALRTAQEVVADSPENIHGLSNLTRFLVLTGRIEEARKVADRLKASKEDAFHRELKIVDALSYLGDDEAILSVYKQVSRQRNNLSVENPLFHHLAAVAACRLGRMAEARRYWDKVLDRDDEFELARDNLDDLDNPIGERDAPFAFHINEWLPAATVGDLLGYQREMSGEEAEASKAARKYLDDHPELIGLIPALLDRGDSALRNMALMISRLSSKHELLDALHVFALSQRGPDSMRFDALATLKKAGYHLPEPLRFWSNGEWRDIRMFGMEITPEPLRTYPPDIEKLMERAQGLMEDHPEKAEKILRQAREKSPDDPSILHNLSITISLQGRRGESKTLQEDIHARFPDYTFARTSLAIRLAMEGNVEAARAMIAPLSEMRRMHYSEFRAYCGAQIEIHLAAGEREEARELLDRCSLVMPDDRGIDYYYDRIATYRKPYRRRTKTD